MILLFRINLVWRTQISQHGPEIRVHIISSPQHCAASAIEDENLISHIKTII